jgi:hypothetical protein
MGLPRSGPVLETGKFYVGFTVKYILWDCFDFYIAYFTSLSVWI